MNRNVTVLLVFSVMLSSAAAANALEENGASALQATPATTANSPASIPRASNKWRIDFDESSKSDGIITFRLWSQGKPIDVPVSVRNNQSENSIARATRDAFRSVLGNGYKMETDDGEDVLVKVSGKMPDFSLALVSSGAKDIDISLRRE